jgi:hypothetical protein
VKTGAHFQQRTYPPVNLTQAFGWVRDPRQDLEQRALARAVAPNDTQHLALLDFKGNIFNAQIVFKLPFEDIACSQRPAPGSASTKESRRVR